jgi:hypothetical protein
MLAIMCLRSKVPERAVVSTQGVMEEYPARALTQPGRFVYCYKSCHWLGVICRFSQVTGR